MQKEKAAYMLSTMYKNPNVQMTHTKKKSQRCTILQSKQVQCSVAISDNVCHRNMTISGFAELYA